MQIQKMLPRPTHLLLVLLFAIGFCAATSVAAQERWTTYINPRFGTSADYPINLFPLQDPPPENGDGQTFRTRDGRARLAIWGRRNAEGNSPQSYVQSNVDLNGVSYRRVTANFYVVSGTREGEIFYERCNFPTDRDGVIDCLNVTYPVGNKVALNPVVARLSQSLRAGRGIEPR